MVDLFNKVRNLYGYATAYNADPELKRLQKIRDHNFSEFDEMIAQVKVEALREAAESDDLIGHMYREYDDHPLRSTLAPAAVRATSNYLHNQADQMEGDDE